MTLIIYDLFIEDILFKYLLKRKLQYLLNKINEIISNNKIIFLELKMILIDNLSNNILIGKYLTNKFFFYIFFEN